MLDEYLKPVFVFLEAHREKMASYVAGLSVDEARWILVAFVLTQWILHTSINFLNVANLNKPLDPLIPKLYGESVLQKYEKSKAYIREKNTFGEVMGIFDNAVMFVFWFAHGYPWLNNTLKEALPTVSPAVFGTIYLLTLTYVSSIISLPWGYYSNFVLEEKYGFNRMTIKTWLKDTIKGWLLMGVLGGVFMYIFLLILVNFAVEKYWWLLASFIMSFQLVMMILQPWIMKLFLEFIAIEDGVAFVSRGQTDKFMRNRYFYPAGENLWETRDSQYKGQPKGACLVLRKDADDKWIIADKTSSSSTSGEKQSDAAAKELDSTAVVHATATSAGGSLPSDVSSWDYSREEEEKAESSLLDTKVDDPLDQKPLWMKKLDFGDLRGRLESMAAEHKFKFQAVYIIDGSTRSEHSNAFFMGFAWFRKICLFDTLLKNLSVDSVCGIMGHEMGHCVMKHIPRQIFYGAVQSFFMLWVMAQFLYNKTLHAAFFVDVSKPDNITPWIGLLITQMAMAPIGFFLGLWKNWLTRKYEYEADAFAVQSFNKNYAQDLVNGLKGLLMENKSHLNPHWLFVWMNHSHPTLVQRVRWIQGLSTKREGKDIVKLDD
ncbi:unnamed protein product [Amoebophrya sp. A25]|nr:unnamed protein product [Amoebophrya sp. A25]|eukprot:GSA25T00015200001.1